MATGPQAVITAHFNRLSESEQERLAILAEECSEVIHAVTKILRHGYDSFNPTLDRSENNRQALEREIGDLQHAIVRMTTEHDLNIDEISARAHSKPERIKKYLHHQE